MSPPLIRSSFPSRMRPTGALLCLAALLTPLASLRAAPASVDEERWHVVEMQGSRVGWLRSTESRTPDDNIRTESEFHITLKRGGIALDLSIRAAFVETPAGQPVAMEAFQRLGQMPIENAYIFEDDRVLLKTTQSGRTVERELPLPPGDWLPPAAAARAFSRHIEAGDKTFTIRTIDPSVGLTVVESTIEVKGETIVEAMGKMVPAIECLVEQSIAPGVQSVMHYDRTGAPVVIRTNLGGLEMVVRKSEKELALAEAEPAELLVSTLIEPDRPIDAPRAVKRGVYTLRFTGPGALAPPTTGAQRVERIDEQRVRVIVDLAALAPAPRAQTRDPRYRASSAMIDASDGRIRALTAQALADLPDDALPSAKAEALRRFVHHYIDEKSLDVGYAAASEVCRTRQGDCTEHAVLLAAMLRAASIPSRVANGVIYVEDFAGERNIFGYHAWAQALLPGEAGAARWVDLDATLPDEAPFDAAHIALSVSAMGEGDVANAMAALAPVMGQLEIEIESVERSEGR